MEGCGQKYIGKLVLRSREKQKAFSREGRKGFAKGAKKSKCVNTWISFFSVRGRGHLEFADAGCLSMEHWCAHAGIGKAHANHGHCECDARFFFRWRRIL